MTFSPRDMRRHCFAEVRIIAATLGALVVLLGAAASVGIAAAPPASAANWAPVRSNDFPDPNILSFGGVYYGFATQNFASASQTINIQVSTSLDGVHWTPLNTDALPRLPGWAKAGNTWAPSVAYNNTAPSSCTTPRRKPRRATSASAWPPPPSRPVPTSTRAHNPSICDNGCRHVPHHRRGGLRRQHRPRHLHRRRRQLVPALEGATGTTSAAADHHLVRAAHTNLTGTTGAIPTQLMLGADEAWQGAIVEGPDMVETQTTSGATTTDHYYLFYAGSDEGASTYAIGWASCPGGPTVGHCTEMSTTGPLLVHRPGHVGAGRARCLPSAPGIGELRHGPGRLAGQHHRLSELRYQAHVPGPAHLRPFRSARLR